MKKFIGKLPKSELHLHIEGTLEPSLAFRIAHQNQIKTEGSELDAINRRKNFINLQTFLDEYYSSVSVLQKEQDFYDLAYEYLKRAAENSVHYVEFFFDPQQHCFFEESA